MKAILVLLALIGSAWALQFPVEYHYIYEGRVAMGIPAIRPQVTALGLKAKLILQMKSKTQGLAQLTDVEVGTYNDDLQCVQLRKPVPFRFSPMPTYKSEIEKPFAIFFKEETGNVMKVPESDVEFITNIRKSVIEILRTEPVVANLGGIQGDRLAKVVSEGRTPEAFTMEEETIFGRCETQYTLTKLSHYAVTQEKELIKKYLKEDMQSESSPRSSGASIPKLEEQYYRLMRSVSFDKCHERVILQHSAGANMSHAGHGQFGSVQARSSIGTYILKGKPGSFRVERAIIEGDIITNPFGFKTQRIQTITNQTMVLEKAQPIQTPLRLPNPVRSVKTWSQEVASPFAAPEGHPKMWINYHNKNDKHFPVTAHYTLLGVFPSPAIVQKYKKNVLDMLDQVVSEMWDTPELPISKNPNIKNTKGSIAATQLYWMSRMMRALPYQTINEIFSQVFAQGDINGRRKQMILVDVAAASGESAPFKVLLEKMKNGQISNQRTASIFMTLPNNLLAPSIIPEILQYVKTLDIEKNPLLTSSALVNFASLAERICLNHKKWNYTAPNSLFGNEMCKPSMILDDFLPHLKQKAQSASRSWERAIYIQAIANLGTTHIVPVLRPYIFGHLDNNPRVRAAAIYALAKRRLPDSAREVVFDTLMEVIHNLEELPQIRQAAFVVLMTWHPDTAWWQMMARMTWREPSQSMAAFITFTIESLAESEEPHLYHQATIAAFVLPLMKPFSASTRYSFNYIFSRFSQKSKVGINTEFAFIQSMRDVVPSEIFVAINQNVGDLNMNIIEVALASEGLGKHFVDLMNAIRYSSSGEGKYRPIVSKDPSSRYAEEFADEMGKSMGSERVHEEKEEANLYMRTFENMYQYIPINPEVIRKVAGEGGSDFLTKLLHGYKFNVTKFLNPINLEYMLPTELGLPVFDSVEMPTINICDMDIKLVVPGMPQPTLRALVEAKEIIVLVKANYKYVSKLIAKTQMPVIWDEKVIEAGIDNVNEINLPAYWNLTWTHTKEVKNLTINMSPYTEKEFPLIHAHNIPFTEIRDMIPSAHSTSDFKVITVAKSRTPIVKVQKTVDKKFTGFDIHLEYIGDAQYPFTTAFIMDYLRKPAIWPKVLTSPTAKQWQYNVIINPERMARNVSLSLAYLTPQGSGRKEGIPEFSPTDSVSERLEKFRSFSEGSKVYGINAQLFFNGTEFRKYEVLAALTRKTQREEKKEVYKTVVAVLADRVPGYNEEPRALCAQAETTVPKVNDLESLRAALQSQLEETIRGQVYYGKTCASSKVSSFNGVMKVSSPRQTQLREEINKICNYDPVNPVVELPVPAVYDEGHLEIDFSKEQLPKTLLNLTYSAQEWIEGYLYPHTYFDNMFKGTPNKVIIHAERPLSSKRYSFWAELPEKRSIVTEIRVPYIVTRIVPWLGLHRATMSESSSVVLPVFNPNTCTIRSSNLRTFDGVSFTYTPVECYTLAVKEFRRPQELLVYTRKNQTGHLEARIFLPSSRSEVIFTSNEAFVDGQKLSPSEEKHVIKDQSGHPVMEVDKLSGSYQVIVYEKLTVKVSNEIEIVSQSSLKGQLRGVCGDFDGETLYDKTGPSGCLYTDDELFKFSWTVPRGLGCDYRELENKHQEIVEFQHNCRKRPDSMKFSGSADMRSDYERTSCYMHVYPVKRDNNHLCVTLEPVQICSEQCTPKEKETRRVPSKCWDPENAPKEVKEAESTGYVTHPVMKPSRIHTILEVTSHKSCVKS